VVDRQHGLLFSASSIINERSSFVAVAAATTAHNKRTNSARLRRPISNIIEPLHATRAIRRPADEPASLTSPAQPSRLLTSRLLQSAN